MDNILIAKLAVSAAIYSIDKPYDYIVPDDFRNTVCVGTRVIVPFGKGNREAEGIVLSLETSSRMDNLKSIIRLLDDSPILTENDIKLALWMHNRFFCAVYEALHVMLPAGLWFTGDKRRVKDKYLKYAILAISGEEAINIADRKRSKAKNQCAVLELLAQIYEASVSELTYFTGCSSQTINSLEKQGYIYTEYREVYRKPSYTTLEKKSLVLNDEQNKAFRGLAEQFDSGCVSAALLYGITGSGKTSVYIELIKHVLNSGRSAIMLVPEISLTPQLISIFSSFFKDDVALLHSALSLGERYDEWKRIKEGKVHVVIGTRSAVFAPLDNLGLIIIDEEQEHTYKSDSSPRYHARDIAKYRCAHTNSLLLLGSATPSVETMYYANKGIYKLYTLEKRYNNSALPTVIITDMKKELRSGNSSDISSVLSSEIRDNINRHEQTILFINRRGASSHITCVECGYIFKCKNCSVSLTYHSANKRMMCHYCGHSEPETDVCPICGGHLKYSGTGTQKVEEDLKKLFPDIGIIRMDADTVSISNSHEKLLSDFKEHNIPILLGTQMVTKGLDFDNVTLVGVISADSSLYINDYRSRERTFSLLTQVVGRSGRGQKKGRAVIQTYTPENEVIKLASTQNYTSFYNEEIILRQALNAPPFSNYFSITCSSMKEADALRVCTNIKYYLLKNLSSRKDVKVLGPAPAPIVRINSRYHYRITLVCNGDKLIRDTISSCLKIVSKEKSARNVVVFADTEPE